MRFKIITSKFVMVALVALAVASSLPVEANKQAEMDRLANPVSRHVEGLDADEQKGEVTAILARAEEYRRRHGVDGELSWRDQYRRSQWTNQRYLERQRLGEAKGIEGSAWINLGPTNTAGRVSSISPHPDDFEVLLVGSASGGVWKTVNRGESWYPTTDGLSDLAVGAVAFSPSDAMVAYVGTGEGDSGEIPGIGLLRSDDGGESWLLPAGAGDVMAEFFFELSVDPSNPDRVVAATNRGLVTTDDGGVTWDVRLPSGGSFDSTTDLQRSKTSPDLMYLANWCIPSCPSGVERVMKSTDGGDTWAGTGNEGLDTRADSFFYTRISLALAPTNHNILYVAGNVSGTSGGDANCGIFKSTDGGATWVTTANPGPYLSPQGFYDNIITVSPIDPDVVLSAGISYVRTTNGGDTWLRMNPYFLAGAGMGAETVPHVDAHAYAWQGNTLWLGNDGGVWKSIDNGANWERRITDMVTRQNYGIAISASNPERIMSGAQDNGTYRRNDEGDNTWTLEIGGDGGEGNINPVIPDILHGSWQFTNILRKAPPSNLWENATPFFDESESTPFVTPITQHPTYANVMFTAAATVFRSDDAGSSWRALGTEVSGGAWSGGAVTVIALTPADPNRIAIAKGSLIYTSLDAGQTWSFSVPGNSALNLDISPFDADKMLAAMPTSYSGLTGVMRTENAGLNWTPSGTGLPPFNTQAVRWDPTDPDVAYAGTDVGLYRSVDGGLTWNEYGNGLPAVSIHDLKILPDGSMLRVGTYGRGTWELQIDGDLNIQPTVNITDPTSDILVVQVGTTLNATAQAVDAEGEVVSVKWIMTRDWASIDGGSGVGSYTSELNTEITSGGNYQLAAVATDARGGTATDFINLVSLDPADNCSTPTIIPGDGPFPVSVLTSNSSGTVQASDPLVPCGDTDQSGEDSGREGSTWFEVTPAETGTYVLSTCGSSGQADTVLSVWSGDACGPYENLACNDDDESVHCNSQRTDSYIELELEAGTTYRVMVGSWIATWRGDFAFQVDCLTCEPPEDDRQLYIVPAAANSPGNEGTTWVTDLDLYNPGSEDLVAELSFLAAGSDNSAVEGVEVSLSAGTARSFANVVSSVLSSEGSGALRILVDGELLIASRTFNDAAEGTFGQFIPGEAGDTAVAAGEEIRLIGLAGNDAFRTNVGLANASSEAATVTIDLVDSSGAVRASRDESLAPYGWLQVNSIFDKENLTGLSAASAVIRNTSAAAGVMAYASVVDGGTGDPTYVARADRATADEALWIAASAHATGVGTSVWRTDLELANVSEVDLVATIELMVHGQDNSSPASFSQAVAAGESLQIGDVVDAAFQFSGAAALKISVDGGELMATSRTYNLGENGTFGQFIAGVAEGRASRTDERVALIQLRQEDGVFRTNVGVVNLTAAEITVRADYFDNEDGFLGTSFYTLAPFEYRQDNGAVPGAGTSGGYAILTSETADAVYLAYASVIDSGSDDPVFIPAAPLAD